MSNLPCGGDLQDKYGWITAPDRDGDGLYDFNLNCWWTVKVPKSLQIQYQVHYVKLDPCSDDSDYLTVRLHSSISRMEFICIRNTFYLPG